MAELHGLRDFTAVDQFGVRLKRLKTFSAWGIVWPSSIRREARSVMYSVAPRKY